MSSLSNEGNFLEDFADMGEDHIIIHGNPSQIDAGVVAGYKTLVGQPFAQFNSPYMNDSFYTGLDSSNTLSDNQRLVDPGIVFNLVFGKTVPDISLNAIANLGYANGDFMSPVFIGDTIRAESSILAVKENSNKKTGIVAVRTEGLNEDGHTLLKYTRWVMVHKKDPASAIKEFNKIPKNDGVVYPETLQIPVKIKPQSYSTEVSGCPFIWDDFEAGQVIEGDYPSRITDAQHQNFTRLFDNPSKVHFSGPEIVYGGFAISSARALTARTLGNAFWIAAINNGSHINPLAAGHMFHARAIIKEKFKAQERDDVGLLRVTFQGARDVPKDESFEWDGTKVDPKDLKTPAQVLNFDVWLAAPRVASLTDASLEARPA